MKLTVIKVWLKYIFLMNDDFTCFESNKSNIKPVSYLRVIKSKQDWFELKNSINI